MFNSLKRELNTQEVGYLANLPTYLKERLVTTLLSMHTTFKKDDGSFEMITLIKQIEVKANSLRFVFKDDSERVLKDEGEELIWVSSEAPLISLCNNVELLVRLKDIVENPRYWK